MVLGGEKHERGRRTFQSHGKTILSFYLKRTIYGKLDSSYLVFVKVGSQVLNGVIIHPKEQALSCNGIVLDNLPPYHYCGRRRKKRRRRKERDLKLPKLRWKDYKFIYAEK
ncbi:hypothetical protein RDI58_017799 [Solanum bulbocastanum]|uniref:Uncharacterized protein n=1 Tax=Solanum bulbocastanum TaxID=147425 RepID=A0AAN8Y966_SOLBU